MDRVVKILNEVKQAMALVLTGLVEDALGNASMQIANQSTAAAPNTKNINDEKVSISKRFSDGVKSNFDFLSGDESKEVNVLDYGSLSLVEEDDLEAIIAMEGMISHSRNCDMKEYLSFTTRLDSMLYGTRIDESNNPMDPEQIGEAFKDAIRPLGLPAKELLIAYREFNSCVFHNLEQVLEEANGILVENNIIPNLDVAARSKKERLNKRRVPRQKLDPTDRAFATENENSTPTSGESKQLLSMMQNLLHGAGASGVINPAQSAPSRLLRKRASLGFSKG